MNDVDRIALVAKAGGKSLDQPDALVRLAEQQGAGVGGDQAAVETGHNAAASARSCERPAASFATRRSCAEIKRASKEGEPLNFA